MERMLNNIRRKMLMMYPLNTSGEEVIQASMSNQKD
jgi:hypothetical protein